MRSSRLSATPVVVLAVVLALVGGACSKSKKSTGQGAAAGPTTTARPTTFPLTGRPVTDPAKANRAAVTVKIDNNSAARPQAGIDEADVVYEEFTEGITRFVVVFHSNDADPVGPVRSVRPADPVIIRPLGGVFGFSGGSPAVRALLPGTPVVAVDENATDVMKRRRGRLAPHNLYTSVAGLETKAPPGAKPPPKFADFLEPGKPFGGAGAAPAAHVSLKPAPAVSAGYDWDPATGTWKRATDGAPATLEGGGQIAPTNVIVQFTPYAQFSGDAKVQYPEVVGSGDAWIFAAGMVVRGRWSKPSPDAVTTFTDAAGAPIVLPPGQTWVHLVAPGTAPTIT